MQHALLELYQVREHLSRKHVALPNQLRQSRQELRISQFDQSITVPHDSCLACDTSAFTSTHRSCFRLRNGCKLDRAPETPAPRSLTQIHPQSQLTLNDVVPGRQKPVYKNRPQQSNPTKAGEQVMRAPPHSSSPRRSKCARITCEHARKPPRRSRRANPPSAGDALRDTRRG